MSVYAYPEWNAGTERGGYAPQLAVPALAEQDRSVFPGLLGVGISLYLFAVVICSRRVDLAFLPQVIGIVVGCFLIIWNLGTGVKLAVPRFMLWYFLWFIWASCTMPLSGSADPYGTIWVTQAKICLMTLVASQCVRTRGDVLALMFALTLATLVVFVVGKENIMQALNYQKYQSATKSRAVDTLLGNANVLAFFAITAVTGAVTCILAYRNILLRLLPGLILPLGLYLLVASGSRKGMLSLVVVAVGLYWYHFRKSWSGFKGKLAALILGGVLVTGAIVLVSRMPTLDRLTSTVVAKEARYVWFIRGLEITAKNPIFGIGVGGFAITGESGRLGIYSHSTITEALTATGIPGFLLYFAAQGALFLQLRRLRKLPLPSRDMVIVNCCMCIYWIWMVYHLFSVMFDNRLACPLMGAIAGYLLHLEKTYGRQSPNYSIQQYRYA